MKNLVRFEFFTVQHSCRVSSFKCPFSFFRCFDEIAESLRAARLCVSWLLVCVYPTGAHLRTLTKWATGTMRVNLAEHDARRLVVSELSNFRWQVLIHPARLEQDEKMWLMQFRPATTSTSIVSLCPKWKVAKRKTH